MRDDQSPRSCVIYRRDGRIHHAGSCSTEGRSCSLREEVPPRLREQPAIQRGMTAADSTRVQLSGAIRLCNLLVPLVFSDE